MIILFIVWDKHLYHCALVFIYSELCTMKSNWTKRFKKWQKMRKMLWLCIQFADTQYSMWFVDVVVIENLSNHSYYERKKYKIHVHRNKKETCVHRKTEKKNNLNGWSTFVCIAVHNENNKKMNLIIDRYHSMFEVFSF